MSDQGDVAPAAWYPDPHGVAELRWWDGTQWTDAVHGSIPPSTGSTAVFPELPPTDVPLHAPAVPAAQPAVAEPAVVAGPEVAPEPVAVAEPATLPEAVAMPAPVAVADVLVDAQLTQQPAILTDPEGTGLGTETWPPALAVGDGPSRSQLREVQPDFSEPGEQAYGWGRETTRYSTMPGQANPAGARWRGLAGPTRPTRSNTASSWVIAFMPLITSLLTFGAIFALVNIPGLDAAPMQLVLAVVAAVMFAVTLLLAVSDRSRLSSFGHITPAHWAWALLGSLVYLIARTISVFRNTSKMTWQLWVNLLLTVGIITVAVAAVSMFIAFARQFLGFF